MKPLYLVLAFILGFLPLTAPLRAQADAAPQVVTSENWLVVFTATTRARRNPNEPMADTIHTLAMNMLSNAESQQKNGSLAKQSINSNQVYLMCSLLLWYSTEIRTNFKGPQDRAEWQRQRIALSTVCTTLKQQYGETVTESWRALNSAAHTLGLPQGSFPD